MIESIANRTGCGLEPRDERGAERVDVLSVEGVSSPLFAASDWRVDRSFANGSESVGLPTSVDDSVDDLLRDCLDGVVSAGGFWPFCAEAANEEKCLTAKAMERTQFSYIRSSNGVLRARLCAAMCEMSAAGI